MVKVGRINISSFLFLFVLTVLCCRVSLCFSYVCCSRVMEQIRLHLDWGPTVEYSAMDIWHLHNTSVSQRSSCMTCLFCIPFSFLFSFPFSCSPLPCIIPDIYIFRAILCISHKICRSTAERHLGNASPKQAWCRLSSRGHGFEWLTALTP